MKRLDCAGADEFVDQEPDGEWPDEWSLLNARLLVDFGLIGYHPTSYRLVLIDQ